MAQQEEAMVERNCKEAQGLSWRSRNRSWWTSAVDLSSTLLSKMDQVPPMGFSLPWQAGPGGDQSKAPQEVAEELPKPGNEIAKPDFEGTPIESADAPLDCEPAAEVEDSPKLHRPEEEDSNSGKGGVAAAELRLTPRGAESRRRTKRMPVELAPVSWKPDDDDAPIRSKKLSAVGREILLGKEVGTTRVHAEDVQRLCSRHRKQVSEAALRRVDNASVLSSRRSCQSSRSWAHLEVTINNTSPHALPAPLNESTVTGDSHLRLHRARLREDAGVLGGSLRLTTREALDVHKTPLTSLPSSPRFSKESRKEKLFRTLGIRTTGAENEIVVAKNLAKQKGVQAGNTLIVSQHKKFAKSLEPRKQRLTNGVRNIDEGCKAAALVKLSWKKRSSTQWLFKWVWGSSKPAPPPPPKLPAATPAPPQEARSKRHKRTSSWGCASHASTAVMTPLRRSRIHQDDNDAAENRLDLGVGCDVGDVCQDFETAGSFRGQESEVFEDCHGSFRSISSPESLRNCEVFEDCHQGSFRSVSDPESFFRKGEVFEDSHGSFRSVSSPESFSKCDVFEDCHPGSFRSVSDPESFRKCDVFEDCQHGSFRSVSNPASFRMGEVFADCHHGSFRSVTSGASFRSVESADETDWGLSPILQLQADQTLTIGDVAALCNSSLKFVFKCWEIQRFNTFLRSQKKRLLRAKRSSDCFNVILSGTDIEVSSMVAAMAYAWFLDNTRPTVTAKAWHAVGMIDIPRHEMHKHKDAAWLFDACGIDPAALLFADEMELASLVGAGRIKISTIGQDVLVTRNEVGSVCTLLGEKLVAQAPALLEPRYLKTLLLAGVLLDTENLDFASMRDTDITTTLLVGSGSLGRNGFFDQLREVEGDEQVSKQITRSYGDVKQLSSSRRTPSGAPAPKIPPPPEAAADHEQQSDKDSLFSHTSSSETGTSSSSLDEDSPRLTQRSPAFKRANGSQSPSGNACEEDEKAVVHMRKPAAATQFVSSSCGTRCSNFPRIRKKLVLYSV